MNTKKVLALFITILVATSIVLSGCASATPTAAPTAEAPTVAAPTAEPVTLVYWSMWNKDEPQGKVVQSAIDAFQAANPGVTIEVTWQGRDVRKLIQPALEAGQAIDLFDNDTGKIANTWGKYVLPLDTYLTQPAVGVEGKTVADTIFPTLLNQFHNADGKIVSVPYNPFAILWLYNKADFTAAGITGAPQTWDDFMAANAKLVAAGKTPITTDVDAYTDILVGDYAERVAGCDKFKAAIQDKTGASWNDPAWVQMANDFAGLASNGYIAKSTAGNLYPAGQQQVGLGEVTMYYNGTWLPTELTSTVSPDFQWGSFPMPNVANGTGSNQDLDMGSQGMTIVQKSKHPDQAFEFIKYIVSLDTQKALAAAGIAASHIDVPWTGAIADGYAAIKNSKAAFAYACGGYDAGDAFSSVLLPAFTDLFVGKIKAADFTARMVKETAAFYKK